MTTRYMVNHPTKEVFLLAPVSVEEMFLTLQQIRKDHTTRAYNLFIVLEPKMPQLKTMGEA